MQTPSPEIDLDPYTLRDIDLVNAACTRWLNARGQNFTLRDIIKASCRKSISGASKVRRAALKEQRFDDSVAADFVGE
jgi:hypothetical protein